MPTIGKLLLRCEEGEKPSRKIVYEAILKELQVPLTGLKEINSGYNAFTEYESDIDKLLTQKGTDVLRKIGLSVKVPPKVKAQRSVICRQVDSWVGEHTGEEIKKEIERCNENLKVAEVIKFKSYTHIFKIEFKNIEMAEKAKLRGILCFNVKITSRQIEQETFIDILTCFNCYAYEDHPTSRCPNTNAKKCSECCGDHDYRQCKSSIKKCINCGGPHRTLAMSCPVKKRHLEEKKKTIEAKKLEKEQATYSQVVERTLETATLQKTAEAISEDTSMRAMLMILDAHIHNIIEPGSYNVHLNKTLQLNNIKPIQFVTPTNSEKIVSQKTLLETLKELTTTKLDGSDNQNEMEAEDQSTQEEEILERQIHRELGNVQDAQKYDTEIYISSNNIQTKDLAPTKLTEMHKKGKLKYRIKENSQYDTQDVEELLDNYRIRVKCKDILYIEPLEYRKIRSGKEQADSPEQGTKRKKPKT